MTNLPYRPSDPGLIWPEPRKYRTEAAPSRCLDPPTFGTTAMPDEHLREDLYERLWPAEVSSSPTENQIGYPVIESLPAPLPSSEPSGSGTEREPRQAGGPTVRGSRGTRLHATGRPHVLLLAIAIGVVAAILALMGETIIAKQSHSVSTNSVVSAAERPLVTAPHLWESWDISDRVPAGLLATLRSRMVGTIVVRVSHVSDLALLGSFLGQIAAAHREIGGTLPPVAVVLPGSTWSSFAAPSWRQAVANVDATLGNIDISVVGTLIIEAPPGDSNGAMEMNALAYSARQRGLRLVIDTGAQEATLAYAAGVDAVMIPLQGLPLLIRTLGVHRLGLSVICAARLVPTPSILNALRGGCNAIVFSAIPVARPSLRGARVPGANFVRRLVNDTGAVLEVRTVSLGTR